MHIEEIKYTTSLEKKKLGLINETFADEKTTGSH